MTDFFFSLSHFFTPFGQGPDLSQPYCPSRICTLIPFPLLLLLLGSSVLWIMLSVWFLLLSCLSLLSRSSTEGGLEFPSFDGKDRVLNINERNYKKALKKYDMLCLLYHEPLPSDRELQQQFHMKEMVLEVRSKLDGYLCLTSHLFSTNEWSVFRNILRAADLWLVRSFSVTSPFFFLGFAFFLTIW